MPNFTKKKDGLPFRAFFYADEGNEPPHAHIHVGEGGADGNGKWWLRDLEREYAEGFKTPMLKLVKKVLKQNQKRWLKIWHDFLGTSEED